MAIPQEFIEEGIQPIVHGITPVPLAKHTRDLERQLRKGIPVAGKVLHFSRETVAAMARPWADPTGMKARFEAPDVKTYKEMTVATVNGIALVPTLQPSMFNARPRPFQTIPAANSSGAVDVAWAATDLSADPTCEVQMLASFSSEELLVRTATEAEGHVLGIQKELSEMVGREGVEDDLLVGLTRFEVGGYAPANPVVGVAYDGGSRSTIALSALLEALDRIGQEVGSNYSRGKLRGLEQLADRLRNGILALSDDDPPAIRHLHDMLEELESAVPANVLVSAGLYRALHLWTVPIRMIVGFDANGSSASIQDAIEIIVGNRHKRGDKPWETAARAVDTRDTVVRHLHLDGRIDEGTMLLLGPKYEEAIKLHGQPKAPDYRAGHLIATFNGTGPVPDEARRLMREVLRTPTARRADRLDLVVAAILEQVKTAYRKPAETALRDVLAYSPYSNANQGWANRDIDPEALRKEAVAELKADVDTFGPARLELGAKGAVALAAIGALDRQYGKNASEVGRPYAVINRMLEEPFGLKLLAKAIATWRSGRRMTAMSPKTRKVKAKNSKGARIPMNGDNLRALFPSKEGTVPESATPEQMAEVIGEVYREFISDTWERLRSHPDVKRDGLAPKDAVREMIEMYEGLVTKSKMLVAKFEDTYAEDGGIVDSDLEEAA